MKTIKERVLSIIAKHFKKAVHEIGLDESFIETFEGDSIDSIEILLELETEFDVLIKKGDVKRLTTPREMITFIGNHYMKG